MTSHSIQKLLAEGSFKGKPIEGDLIETHISWVILTQDFAFKIKKPIKYSFLDFSSLEKRKFYCERELKLNRRLSDIYLDVLPIRKKDDRLFIGRGSGEIIEYAVRMRRLQADKKMDCLLRNQQLTISQVKTLARKIANFHLHASIVKRAFDKAKLKEQFNDIESVREWVSKELGPPFATIIDAASSFSNHFLDQYEKLVTERISRGFQRDLHGDLHSKNIFLYEEPIIFDCIEFNDEFRQIDVLNELAFFCMDVEAFQAKDLSSVFMKEYLTFFPVMESLEEKLLFLYFKSYRANIRAKVNVFRAQQTKDEDVLKRLKLEVATYLELMQTYIEEIKAANGYTFSPLSR